MQPCQEGILSTSVALDNIGLRPSARWAHTEYSINYHKDFLARHTFLSQEASTLMRHGYDRFAFDFLWNVNDGIIDWGRTGRVTDMGHAVYAAEAVIIERPPRAPSNQWTKSGRSTP